MTRAAEDQWHKIAALILHKLGRRDVVITAADIAAATGGDEMLCVVLDEQADGLHVRLVTEAEGRALAKKAGGLPV
jgi:hypothetical protein